MYRQTQELEVNASTEKITTISPDPVTHKHLNWVQYWTLSSHPRHLWPGWAWCCPPSAWSCPAASQCASWCAPPRRRPTPGSCTHQIPWCDPQSCRLDHGIKSCQRPYSTVPCIDILIEPDRYPGPVLEVAEDEVDGLHHHLLNLLAATVAHLFSRGALKENKLIIDHSCTVSVEVAIKNPK